MPQLDGIAQNAKAEDFRMKNKVYEIIKYGNICLKDFPRYERNGLALDIRQCEYAILRHVITLENKHYKKTTLGELDTEVDILRHLLRLALGCAQRWFVRRLRWEVIRVNKIKHLFPKIFDFENLFDAYKAGIRGKRDRPDIMVYTEKPEENLIELQNELIWKTYKVGRYRMFYVYEPKRRLIMALQFKDRVAQHAIYRQLNPLLDKQFIYDSYACRNGKGTHKAVARLQYWFRQVSRKPGKYYYLKLDISKYFYRIDHEILMGILRKKIADEDLLEILEGIVNCEDTHFGLPMGADIGDVAFSEMLADVGLPIGNLTSQMFANLYLDQLDQFCKHQLGLHYYIRYMDDVIILHNSKKHLERVKNQIANFLESELHLNLNNKTCIRPVSMGAEFVGFRVWATHVKLRRKTARKMVKRLEYVFAAYAAGEIDREGMERTVASYKGALKHFNSHGMAQKLNEIYKKEVSRNGRGTDKGGA